MNDGAWQFWIFYAAQGAVIRQTVLTLVQRSSGQNQESDGSCFFQFLIIFCIGAAVDQYDFSGRMGKADRVAVFYIEERSLNAFRRGIGCREASAYGVRFLVRLCDSKADFVNLPCLNFKRLAADLQFVLAPFFCDFGEFLFDPTRCFFFSFGSGLADVVKLADELILPLAADGICVHESNVLFCFLKFFQYRFRPAHGFGIGAVDGVFA